MQVIYGPDRIKKSKKTIVATIGIFDGLHLGHQYLIRKVVRQAGRLKVKSAVFTFDPHPLTLLNPPKTPPLLIFLRHRLRLISELGVDLCLILKFNRRLAAMPAEKFIKKIVVDNFRLKKLLVGENFYFGRDKSGSFKMLQYLGEKYNFKVEKIKIIKFQNHYISSTKIRKLIKTGKLNLASRLLGRPVSILGTVTKGFCRGRALGFPTANINPHHEVLPPFGVYAVRIKIGQLGHKGILNIGKRPTFFKEAQPSIEVHLFDFQKDIYGKDIEVTFLKRIRPEKQFKNPPLLARQIEKDVKRVKKYFSSTKFHS